MTSKEELQRRMIEADELVSVLHDMCYSANFDLSASVTQEHANRLIWKIHDKLREGG